MKEENEKVALKLNIQKTKIMGSRNLYSYPVTQLIFYKGLNISVSVGIIETLFIKEGQKMKKN